MASGIKPTLGTLHLNGNDRTTPLDKRKPLFSAIAFACLCLGLILTYVMSSRIDQGETLDGYSSLGILLSFIVALMLSGLVSRTNRIDPRGETCSPACTGITHQRHDVYCRYCEYSQVSASAKMIQAQGQQVHA